MSTADEQPKKDIAKKVITAKHKYFFPDHGIVVDAEDSIEAAAELKKRLDEQKAKAGDGK
jgi:hypothetical protein